MRRSPASVATVLIAPAVLRRGRAIAERRAEPVRRSARRRSRRADACPTTSAATISPTASWPRCTSASAPARAAAIETSMLEATIAFAPDAFINHKRYGMDIGPLTRVSASQSYAFRCQDGKLIAIHHVVAAEVLGRSAQGARAARAWRRTRTSPRRENRIDNYTTLARRARQDLRHTPPRANGRSAWKRGCALRAGAQHQRSDRRSAGAPSRHLLSGAAPTGRRGLGRQPAGVHRRRAAGPDARRRRCSASTVNKSSASSGSTANEIAELKAAKVV